MCCGCGLSDTLKKIKYKIKIKDNNYNPTLKGERETIDEDDGDSFGFGRRGDLGILEQIAQFDPFLADHIVKSGQKGKGNTSLMYVIDDV